MPVIKVKKEDGAWEEISSSGSGKVEVDASLSIEGAAADAKAVGDALADISLDKIVQAVIAALPSAEGVSF